MIFEVIPENNGNENEIRQMSSYHTKKLEHNTGNHCLNEEKTKECVKIIYKPGI